MLQIVHNYRKSSLEYLGGGVVPDGAPPEACSGRVHRVELASRLALPLIAALISSAAMHGQTCTAGQPCVLTQHNNIGRTGLNPNETQLTPSKVSSSSFGKQRTLPLTGALDGQVMAQPLYMPSVSTSTGVRPIVFLATQGAGVYAFDASTGAQVWYKSLLGSQETTGTEADYSCTDISSIEAGSQAVTVAAPSIGVTSTPVIDDGSGTLWVVAKTKSTVNGTQYFRLHGLSIADGSERTDLGSPVTLTGSVAGTGEGSVGGTLSFNPSSHHQRVGLLNLSGKIYAGFASLCDTGAYHGWILGYDSVAKTLTTPFVTSPNGSRSGIWMSGTGLAADFDGTQGAARVFPVTGNGTESTDPNHCVALNGDYRDSVLQLSVGSTGTLAVQGSFTPFNESAQAAAANPTLNTFCDHDTDVGSGGALLIPDGDPFLGSGPRLLVQQGKSGIMYILNRDNLGGYNPATDTIVQEMPAAFPLWGAPAYWFGNVYVWGAFSKLQQFKLTNGALSTVATNAPESDKAAYGQGATPSVSSSGNSNGIVWAVDWNRCPATGTCSPTQNPQVLYAYDATNVSFGKLWSSALRSSDTALTQQKFSTPTIADGRVFLADGSHVQVYGMLSQGSAPVITSVTVSSVTTTTATITWTTDQAASSTVNYGVASSYGSQSTNSTLVTSHSVILSSLGAGTTYHYQVVSANSGGMSTSSSDATFTTSSGTAPFTIQSIFAYPTHDTDATVGWATNPVATTSQVFYWTTDPIHPMSTTRNNALNQYHGELVSSLTPNTVYFYYVVSSDAAGNTAKGCPTQGPIVTTLNGNATTRPFLSALSVAGISTNSATITWTSDQATTSQVNYGTTCGYGLQSSLNSTLSTSHSVTLCGLAAGTLYNYAALSANSAGTLSASVNLMFTTTGSSNPAPVISAVSATNITSSGVTITWTTDQTASSQVAYGTTSSYGSLSSLNPALSTAHSVSITGLTAGTTYNYGAISANLGGASTTSSNATFTTSAGSGTPPVISVVTAAFPSNSSGSTAADSSVTITWTTDQASTSQVFYGTSTAYGQQSALNPALTNAHAVTVTGLTPGNVYNYQVVSANGSGASASSANNVISFVIWRLAPYPVTATGATILWTTADPTSYPNLAQNVSTYAQVFYGTTSNLNSSSLTASDPAFGPYHQVSLPNLTPGTTYYYLAVSKDAAGNTVTMPGPASFTTPLH